MANGNVELHPLDYVDVRRHLQHFRDLLEMNPELEFEADSNIGEVTDLIESLEKSAPIRTVVLKLRR